LVKKIYIYNAIPQSWCHDIWLCLS